MKTSKYSFVSKITKIDLARIAKELEADGGYFAVVRYAACRYTHSAIIFSSKLLAEARAKGMKMPFDMIPCRDLRVLTSGTITGGYMCNASAEFSGACGYYYCNFNVEDAVKWVQQILATRKQIEVEVEVYK